jgi:hypothetical protein
LCLVRCGGGVGWAASAIAKDGRDRFVIMLKMPDAPTLAGVFDLRQFSIDCQNRIGDCQITRTPRANIRRPTSHSAFNVESKVRG